MYRRTQVNKLLPLIIVPALVVVIWAARSGVRTPPLALVIVTTLLLVATTTIFSSLTIEVVNGELRFHFGLGFWKKRYRIADIARATATRSVWWEGLGIRVTPRGWLYTVSGGPAVEITPRGKPAFRLGTPEPEAVIAAIEAARVRS